MDNIFLDRSTYETLTRLLVKDHAYICDIDQETGGFQWYMNDVEFGKLKIAESGENFFREAPYFIRRLIYPEDQDYVMRMIERDTLIKELEEKKEYSFLFRMNVNGAPVYIQFKAVPADIGGRKHIILGVFDVDDLVLKNLEHMQTLEELKKSRLKTFTNQMQPHFLYNTLGSIQEIILEDPEAAASLIGDFTTHLRSCIQVMTRDDFIPFSLELKNIRAYVNIEKMRFGKKLRVHYDIKADEFSILPLSIQPLAENAIRHGIYERGTRGGTLTIRSREAKDAWIIEVEDDGAGFDVDSYRKKYGEGKGGKVGLYNTIYRLNKALNATVDIKSRIGVGTKVTVTIPKGDKQNENDNR